MKKKRLIRSAIALALLVPGGALAVFGIGDTGDAVLTAILAELKYQTTSLVDMVNDISNLKVDVKEMREGVADAPLIESPAMPERDIFMSNILEGNGDIISQLPEFKPIRSLSDIYENLFRIWGKEPSSDVARVLSFLHRLPVYAMNRAQSAEDAAQVFSATAEEILRDIDISTEGKAILRSAQANALQVKQLAQIESNQAAQLSLQSQQVVSENEVSKGLYEFSDEYFKMLHSNFTKLVEVENRK